MSYSLPVVVYGGLAAYFGYRLFLILPTVFRLLGALLTKRLKWPGPRIHDPNPSASMVRKRMGVGYQNLYPAFFSNTLGGLAAFAYFVLALVSTTPWLRGQILIKSNWAMYCFALIVCIGGGLALQKADQNQKQVATVLEDLAQNVEPRAVEGGSARAEYAIEHPLLHDKGLDAGQRKAFDLYYESVRCYQDGDEFKALSFYQEALSADPSLHKDACQRLASMAENCNPVEEGGICYWLGIHSEYLSDWKQAAAWYERAIVAYHQLGYARRESRAHCNLGNVKMHLREADDAMDEFEKAIALDPKNGLAYLNIGRTYYGLGYPEGGFYEQALDAFASAIVADPLTYGPQVIASLREIGYTWEQDLEKITQRVERINAAKNAQEN